MASEFRHCLYRALFSVSASHPVPSPGVGRDRLAGWKGRSQNRLHIRWCVHPSHGLWITSICFVSFAHPFDQRWWTSDGANGHHHRCRRNDAKMKQKHRNPRNRLRLYLYRLHRLEELLDRCSRGAPHYMWQMSQHGGFWSILNGFIRYNRIELTVGWISFRKAVSKER